jgi:hypothetical protein
MRSAMMLIRAMTLSIRSSDRRKFPDHDEIVVTRESQVQSKVGALSITAPHFDITVLIERYSIFGHCNRDIAEREVYVICSV